MTNYIVICRVSGGITGTREAPLKSLGEIQVFDSREEAEKRASSLMQAANSPYRTASFSYWVEEKGKTDRSLDMRDWLNDKADYRNSHS